jgi:hypothetical protein
MDPGLSRTSDSFIFFLFLLFSLYLALEFKIHYRNRAISDNRVTSDTTGMLCLETGTPGSKGVVLADVETKCAQCQHRSGISHLEPMMPCVRVRVRVRVCIGVWQRQAVGP